MPQQRVSNFRFGIIFNLVSPEGEGGIYGLQLIVNEKDKYIFLDAEKIGKPNYFLKKITAKGGQLLVDKRVQRENILIRFWAILYDLCQETIVIPTHRGWMKKQNDEYKFVKEGEMLWEDVLRQAK